jgi:hypothetical protein
MYKIVCNDLNIKDLYVSQTTNFRKRKNGHKSVCYNEDCEMFNLKVYQFIRANGGWSNWSMLEIEKFTCNDSNEAHTRERYWVETLNATLNCNIPSRTNAEFNLFYREKNLESILEKSRNYNQANREHRHQKFDCSCDGKYIFSSKERHFKSKRHLECIENPELPRKEPLPNPYYIVNKERLHEKFDCPCGGKYTVQNKIQHLKSLKHSAYFANIQSPPLAI